MNPAPGIRNEVADELSLETAVLQLMAHELRQPLSAIESIAYYLNMVLPQNQARTREQVERIRQLVEQSNWIVSCGLRMTDTAAPVPQSLDLEEVITQVVAARAGVGGAPVLLNLSGAQRLVQFDPEQARALIENLVTLLIQLAGREHPLRIRTWTDGAAFLEIATAATGHRSEVTFGPGAALGLACARRIVEANGGGFGVQADPSTGIRVQVVLP